MNPINLINLTMSQIIIFCATARFENFSSAAKYLNITQPMVSRSISQLESLLGMELFFREKQRVKLTPCGSYLADSWENLIESIEYTIQTVKYVESQANHSFTLCDDRGTDKTYYLYPILEEFTSQNPDTFINIEQTDAAWAIDSLYRGDTDVAFIMDHELPGLDPTMLEWEIMYKTTWGAFIPKSNPLSEKDSLTFEDLADQPLILLTASASRYYASTVVDLLKSHGIQPNIQTKVSNNASLSFSIHQGNGIILANEFLAVPREDETRFFPLSDTENSLVIVWRKNCQNHLISRFRDIAKNFFKNVYRSPYTDIS